MLWNLSCIDKYVWKNKGKECKVMKTQEREVYAGGTHPHLRNTHCECIEALFLTRTDFSFSSVTILVCVSSK